MEHTALPISQFADVALIPRPTLSQILSGRNKKISNEVLEKLHTAFPSLNISWLLFGDGEMLRSGFENANPSYKAEVQTKENTDQPLAYTELPKQPCSPSIPIPPNIPSPLSGETAPGHATAQAPLGEKKSEPQIALAPDTNKKIQTIMVFYTDNSFEIFTPSQR